MKKAASKKVIYPGGRSKSANDDELLLADAFELEWPITSLLHCKIERRFKGENDRRVLIHRIIYVGKIAPETSSAVAMHYMDTAVQQLADMSPNGQIPEPFTGMGIIYPTQAVHTIEGSLDALLNYLMLLDQKTTPNSPFSSVKVVVFAHDIAYRLFPTWVLRAIDIAAAIVIGSDADSQEPITKTANDMINQFIKLSNFVHEIPPEKVKSILDNLHEKAGPYLPTQDTIATLLSSNDHALRSAAEFLATFKRPVLDAFDVQVIWPIDLNISPHNWSLMV